MTSGQGITVEQVREAYRRARLVPSDEVVYGHFDGGDRRACATVALLVADGVTYDGLRDLLRADAYTATGESAYADRLSDVVLVPLSRGYVHGFDNAWDGFCIAWENSRTGVQIDSPHARDYRRGWADGDAARRAILGEDA